MDPEMILTVYMVDDEPAALRNLKTQLEKIPTIKIVGMEKDSLLAKRFLSNETNIADVVFLDIEMRGIDGLELANLIRGKAMIIFTTAHDNYAVVSYEFEAVDYLLKPIGHQRLQQAIDKCLGLKEMAMKLREKNRNDYFLINDSNTHSQVKLRKDSIFYIMVEGNYIRMYKEDGSSFMPKLSLAKAISIISEDMFLRIHKSYAINLTQAKALGVDYVELNNGSLLPIGRRYKHVRKILTDILGKQ